MPIIALNQSLNEALTHCTRMLDGHAEIQKRTSTPFEAILRSVAIQLKEEDKLGDLFNASELVDIVEGDKYYFGKRRCR